MIGRRFAAAAAILGAVGLATAPQPAHAGISTGAAVGLGLGAFALGTALAAPYYYQPAPYYGYPAQYYYAPPAAYYPPPPYYAPRSCWSPYYNSYVAC